MMDSCWAGAISSSRRRLVGQGLCIEQFPELTQGGESDARLRCIAQDAASHGVEHPGRDSEGWAVSEPDEVMIPSQPAKSADDGNLLVPKRMIVVANAQRTR
jgi:hypothetical protein